MTFCNVADLLTDKFHLQDDLFMSEAANATRAFIHGAVLWNPHFTETSI